MTAVAESVQTAPFTPAIVAAPRSLRRNVAWTLVGNVVYSGCQWALLVVIARLGTPEMVGHFALGLALTAPVVMFTNLQLASVQATDGAGMFSFAEYRRVRLLGCLVAAVVIAACGAVVRYDLSTWAVVGGITAFKLIEAVSDVNYGLLQRHERMDRPAISLAFRGVLSVVAVAVVLRATHSLAAAALGMAAMWLLVLVVYDSRAPKIVGEPARGPVRTDALKRIVRIALPLGFTAMLVSLAVSIPRYFVDQMMGRRALGIFSAMAYLIVAGRLVALPIGLAASPRLGRFAALRDRAGFNSLLGKLLLVGVAWGGLGVLGAWIAGEPVVRLLYGPSYGNNGRVITLLMTAAGFGYLSTFMQSGLTALRYTARQPFIIAASITTSAAGCWLLIPRFGLLGAALALVASAVVECIASAIALTAGGGVAPA